ncbi:MAG: response regulator, partial [Anaerolineae bacterium]|nr:response regulator [Anaerolineae bacterium]
FTVLFLYGLTLAASWLMDRPLKTSAEWAVSGWARAHASLAEARQRRAELYRALRALEEATYRIERMNNELLLAQREAEEARALKARFVATVSHELRGPLNLILGFAKLMALSPESYGQPLPPAYRADVDAIYRNAQHLVSLVDDVLELSQIEAQRLALLKDRIDLETDVVEKVVRIVQPLVERKGLYLRKELAGNLPWILADPVRLRQALLNLLTNAVRFTEKGGITVRTSLQDGQILVSVADTGPGIAREDIPKLFKEFHQVHRPKGEKEKGSGLGLSISKHLIELHGGKIWVESERGRGTTFYFTVPLLGERSSQEGLLHIKESWQLPQGPETCLVVHENPEVVRLLARHMEGYRIVGLPDEKEVPKLVEKLHPKAIITTRPLAPKVRQRLASLPYDVPVISCAMPRLGSGGSLKGILGYLVKPIMPEALVAVMRKVERDGETRVLLVDDDPDAVRLLERMLLALPRPYEIWKAYDGAQALEVMREVLPDIVLMDLVMPGMDGREAIRQMRADERLSRIPVVIISARGWSDKETVVHSPIVVSYRRPMNIARAARCFQSVLSELAPQYLVQSEPVPPSGGG